jgi:hypothetical protein
MAAQPQAAAAVNPYLIYVKLGAAALVLAIVASAGYHFGGLSGDVKAANAKTALEADRAEQSELTAKAVLAERASAAAAAVQDHATEAIHAKVIVSIDSATPLRTPVFVCSPGPLRVGTVPSAEAEAGGVPADPAAGRGQPVDRGRDIRGAIEEVKKRLEKVMADYRQQDAEWTAK